MTTRTTLTIIAAFGMSSGAVSCDSNSAEREAEDSGSKGQETDSTTTPNREAGTGRDASIAVEAGSKVDSAGPSPGPLNPLNLQLINEAKDLPGKVIFVEERGQPYHRVASYSFAEEELATVFQVPRDGLVFEVHALKNDSRLALSYAAPADLTELGHTKAGLYLLDITEATKANGDAEPELLVEPETDGVFYHDPIWHPGGEAIYYVSRKGERNTATPEPLKVERYDLKTKQRSLIAASALQPQVSVDGLRITYVRADPVTDKRSIVVANSDGSNARELVPEDRFFDLDLPRFTPDGLSIYVSVLRSPTGSLRWWERLLGIGVAHAHGNHYLPADWWQVGLDQLPPQPVPADAGVASVADAASPTLDASSGDGSARPTAPRIAAKRITDSALILRYGTFAPDGSAFAFATHLGLHVKRQGEAAPLRILGSRAFGVFSWVE